MLEEEHEPNWMTYGQLATRLGVTPDAIRHRARKESWGRREGNDGKVWVNVPAEIFSAPPRNAANSDPERPEGSDHSDLESGRSDPDSNLNSGGEIRALRDHLQALTEQLAQQRADADADRQRLTAQIEWLRSDLERAQGDVERERQAAAASAADAKARVEQVLALMAERAVDKHELGQLRAEIEEVKRPRSFLQRLFGSR